MTAAVSLVTIGDADLAVVEHEGRGWVSVRRVCLHLGLDPDGQRVKLQQKRWATTSTITVLDAAGRRQNAFFVDADSLPMWLATVDVARVDETVAKRLELFQCEARRVLSQHFGARTELSSVRGSGGIAASGGRAVAGGALAQLELVEGMVAALKATLADVAAVRADVAAVDARVAAAEAKANDAALVAARAISRSTAAREERRACKAAQRYITRAVQGWCSETGTNYRDIYSRLRRALGLRRTQDGGPALGRAVLEAHQILLLARTATEIGVRGVDVRKVSAILNGDDGANVVDVPTSTMEAAE